jgi:2-keto-4-pentenoate hydratase/2-oxohepta-3-ene-1,7-dioic acid hydratase in catechol pathway
MKLVSFSHNGREGYGIVVPAGVIDAEAILGHRYPALSDALSDMDALAALSSRQADFSHGSVEFLPPIPLSKRIICIGLNYKSHIAETGREAPQYPMLFPRYPDSLVGQGAPLIRPAASEMFDFEGELAFVIGRGGRNIPASQALDYVAGYSCFNDGSIRDFQRHTTQFLPGKNFARSGSFGPWLTTADELPDIGSQTLETKLNGQIVQSAKLNDLLFGIEDLIAYMSKIWPLQPGDVVATGTTGGVGAMRNPPLWMKPGDHVSVEISGIGILSNEIADEAAMAQPCTLMEQAFA